MTKPSDSEHRATTSGPDPEPTHEPEPNGAVATRSRSEPPQPTAPLRTAARFKLEWNPAVFKGAAIAGAGLFILLTPEISLNLLVPVLALVMIGVGVSDTWRWVRGSKQRLWSQLAMSMLAILLGVLLMTYPAITLDSLAFLIGAYLMALGVAALSRIVFRHSPSIVMDVIGAGIGVSLGLLLIVVPEQIIQALLGTIGLGALIIGGVILAYGLRAHSADADIDADTLGEIAAHWFRSRDVGDSRRADLSEDLYYESPGLAGKLTAWWVMLLLSVTIATYAILQDSTAVVIGAMLVAPLMTPIVGAAAAIVNGRAARLAGSLALVGAGVVVAILLSYVIGKWTPNLIPLESNTQVTSRTSPNIIDMGIALAAGAAGAFAMINRRVASGLAGVAIAVALVPPLSVVGLMIGAGDAESATGAFLLFLTNLVSILLSATAVFALSGWTSVSRLRSQASSIATTVGVILAAGMIILLPLMFTSQGILIASNQQKQANTIVTNWLTNTSPGLVLDKLTVDGSQVTVAVSGPGTLGDPGLLSQELTESFGQPTGVEITLTPTTIVTYTPDGGEVVQRPERVADRRDKEAGPTPSPDPGDSKSASPTPSKSGPG